MEYWTDIFFDFAQFYEQDSVHLGILNFDSFANILVVELHWLRAFSSLVQKVFNILAFSLSSYATGNASVKHWTVKTKDRASTRYLPLRKSVWAKYLWRQIPTV